MKFGRKARTTAPSPAADTIAPGVDEVGPDKVGTDKVGTDKVGPDKVGTDKVGTDEKGPAASGPYDLSDVDVDNDGVERIDLGAMLFAAPADGLELRIEVDETSGEVQSVLITGPTGAVEVRVFAARRNGDLWSDVRRQIASETARQGGTATERDGANGTELVCHRVIRAPDGTTSLQPSRIVGFNGPRWFLRATYVGAPAVKPEEAGPWEAAIASVVVRRGDGPMAPGDQLPITLPPQARRVE